MEMSQKAAEEDERYKKEMAKYGAHFSSNSFFMFYFHFKDVNYFIELAFYLKIKKYNS